MRYEYLLEMEEALLNLLQHEVVLAATIAFFVKLHDKSGNSTAASMIFNFAGTTLHETAHWITALVLNAKPAGFSLLPKKTDGGIVLGSVEVRNLTFYNALPVALAPLSLLVLAYHLKGFYFQYFSIGLFQYLGYLFLLVVLLLNAIPSGQDIKAAFSKPLGVIFYFFILYGGYRYAI